MSASAWYVEIIPYRDTEPRKVIGPFLTERQADRAERGVMHNLNHHDYYTMVSTLPPSDRDTA